MYTCFRLDQLQIGLDFYAFVCDLKKINANFVF